MRRQLSKLALLLVLALTLLVSHAKEEIEFNTQEFPPYSFKTDGQLGGAISELLAKACEQMNADCSFFIHRYWGTALKNVKKRNSDALFVIGKNATREQWLHFSIPILPAEYGFFSLKEEVVFNEITDLSGLVIGVYGPSNTAYQLAQLNKTLIEKKIKPMVIQWSYSTLDTIEDMVRGKVDAIYSNKAVGEAYNQLMPQSLRMRYLGTQLSLDYYVGFNKESVSRGFVDKFNHALIKLDRRGEVRRLMERHNLPYRQLENQ